MNFIKKLTLLQSFSIPLVAFVPWPAMHFFFFHYPAMRECVEIFGVIGQLLTLVYAAYILLFIVLFARNKQYKQLATLVVGLVFVLILMPFVLVMVEALSFTV